MQYHLTEKSTNVKTGPIPVSTTSADSCGDCPFKGNGCYAQQGPLALFWQKVTDGRVGTSFAEFVAKIAALPAGTLWRHNQAGDLPGVGNEINADALTQLVDANRGKRGFTYTHKPMTRKNRAAVKAANANGFTINLSGNNLSHADKLADLGIAPVCVVLPQEYARKEQRIGKTVQWAESLAKYKARIATLPHTTPKGRKVAVCPAVYLDTDCANCQLCQRQNRQVIPGFPAHGSGKAKAESVAKGA